MHLIIKGNRFEAAKAAADRGIPLAFVSEFAPSGHPWQTTTGETPDAYWDAVAAWFRESGQAPFPAGACLHYSYSRYN